MVTKFTIIHKYTRIMDHFKKFTKIFHLLVSLGRFVGPEKGPLGHSSLDSLTGQPGENVSRVGGSSPSINIVDFPPFGLKQARIVSKNATDVHGSGHMSTATACPGPSLALPWHSGTTDIHLDPLDCLALVARGWADQRPVVRNIGQHNCV